MLRVITISTHNFLCHTRRLLASLRNSGNNFHLTVYCDDADFFRSLRIPGVCEPRTLPEIKSLGPKRAKLTAYVHALNDGDFLYLDSDIIVLQPIDELACPNNIAGCYDDLSAVRGIEDRSHPWPLHPELENRTFINSGVFYAPVARREFFRDSCRYSLDDSLWNRYILPGILYDNSFLCAYLNLLNEPVDYVDSTVYNWQGLFKGDQLLVERRGRVLVNKLSGQVLRIAHFAGLNPDAAMCDWPPEVTSLLCALGGAQDVGREHALAEFVGTMDKDFENEPADPLANKMFVAAFRELRDLSSTHLRREYGREAAYLRDPHIFKDLVHSSPMTTRKWNSLSCGGAYLEGEEYNFLQRTIQQLAIKKVVETGAGETSLLLKDCGVDALSIETQMGPWLTRALNQGCDCALINFDKQEGLFAQEQLQAAVARFGPEIDMLFIDSPTGTEARRRVLAQISEITRPKYLLVHDALRDARNIFEYQYQSGYKLIAYLDSGRGLALLRHDSVADQDSSRVSGSRNKEVIVFRPAIRIEVAGAAIARTGNQNFRLLIKITNLCDEELSSHYLHPINVAYHELKADGSLINWDGARTALPFDILPGNSATFDMEIVASAGIEGGLFLVTLVQETVSWFDADSPSNHVLFKVEGGDRLSIVAEPDHDGVTWEQRASGA